MIIPHSHLPQCLAPVLALNMKTRLAILILFMSLGVTSLFADETNTNAVTDPGIGFSIGQSAFPRGDFIEITSVERSQDRVVVKGHYKLVSADSARLALFTTTSTAIAVPTDRKQLMRISKGMGDFELTHPNLVPGLNHVTMYSIPGGKPFAGVYFGNKEEAAEESKLDLDYYADETTTEPAKSDEIHQRGNRASVSGPNQALLDYLGNPVVPPANMDVRYTKEGLSNAVQLAARNAGITLKKIAIDDSEYPFLVGVICGGSDFPKLKSQIKKMDGYEYSGSVGNDINSDGSKTCNAFSIVPYWVHPRKAMQQIEHRLMLRYQVFYAKLSARQ
jgi:hypothetical protein